MKRTPLLLRPVAWAIYDKARLRKTMYALVAVLLIPTVGGGIYAAWWNATQRPAVQAQAQAEWEAEQARITAAPDAPRPTPKPVITVGGSIPIVANGETIDLGVPATSAPDAAAVTTAPEASDKPQLPLMPDGSEAGKVATVPADEAAAGEVAVRFARAYADGDRTAIGGMMTGQARATFLINDPLALEGAPQVLSINAEGLTATVPVEFPGEARMDIDLAFDTASLMWLVDGFSVVESRD